MSDITGPELRPIGANGPIPPEWQTLPAGRNHRGDELELVYNPRRYDVLLVHSDQPGIFPRLPHEPSDDLMLDALGISGWEPLNRGGRPRLWLRDREAAQLCSLMAQAGKRPEIQFVDVGPTRPFTRTDMTPIPPGWVAEPAGDTAGQPVEVVYNPARHEIMSLLAEPPSPRLLDELSAQGWQSAHANDSTHLLWRDRLVHIRTALERAETGPAVEIQGPGR